VGVEIAFDLDAYQDIPKEEGDEEHGRWGEYKDQEKKSMNSFFFYYFILFFLLFLTSFDSSSACVCV